MVLCLGKVEGKSREIGGRETREIEGMDMPRPYFAVWKFVCTK